MTARILLGVWAHPDDEAYLSAGLMHQFTERHHTDREQRT
jgi:LmbE family N-acetylglucosaminyl deacetylase